MSDSALPSIAAILDSKEFLSASDATYTVVRIGERLAEKYGPQVTLLEGQSLRFVAEHSNVPVPKVHGALTEEGTGLDVIIMDMVSGEPLTKAWPNLTSYEKQEVVQQFKQAMIDLRNIPSPGYIGSIK